MARREGRGCPRRLTRRHGPTNPSAWTKHTAPSPLGSGRRRVCTPGARLRVEENGSWHRTGLILGDYDPEVAVLIEVNASLGAIVGSATGGAAAGEQLGEGLLRVGLV